MLSQDIYQLFIGELNMLREISECPEWDLGNILLKPIMPLLSKLNCRIKLPQDESQKYKLNQKAIRDIYGLKVLTDLLNAKL